MPYNNYNKTNTVMFCYNQTLCSVQIMVSSEFDKRALKTKSDIIDASKCEILFIKNISLALPQRQTPNNLWYTILHAIRVLLSCHIIT